MIRPQLLVFGLALALFAVLPASAQEEKPADSRPAVVAQGLEEQKVPTTAAEALELQKAIQAKFEAIPVDSVDKKDLRAAYDVQVQQLGQLAREMTALETFNARREELQKEKDALDASLRALGEPVTPTYSWRTVDKDKDTEARTLLDKLQRELTEASNRLTQKRKAREELGALIEGTSETIGKKAGEIAGAEQALREAQQKGEDVLLREQQVFSRRLERAVLVQRKAVLEKEQTTGRRQLEEERAAVEENLARRRLADQTAIRDAIARALAERQEREGRTALDNAKRDRERYPEGHPWRVYYDFQVEALEAEQQTAALRAADAELNTRLADVGIYSALLAEAEELNRNIDLIEKGEGEGLLPDSAAEIREIKIGALARFEGGREATRLLRDAAVELRKAQKISNKALVRVQSRVELARNDARKHEGSNPSSRPTDQGWIDIETQLRKSLSDQVTEVQQQVGRIEKARNDWAGLQRIADDNIAYLESRLRWTREESHITLGSIETAAGDATDTLENGPEHVSSAFSVIESYLTAKDRRTRLLFVGLLFVALGFLLWRIRRRLPTTYNWIDEQSKSGSQFFKVLGIYLRRTDLSLLIALLFVGAPWAAGMETKIVLVAICLFATPFLYRLGRATLDIFFQPGSNEVRFLDMDEKLAEIVHRAGRWMLNLALFFLPAGYLMELAGYDDRNPGFVELWWLVHGTLTQLILLFSIFRPIVVRTLIRGQNIVAVSLKAWIILGYPLVVGGTLFIFLLGALGYDTAQDFFQVIIVKSLFVLLGAYVAYRAILRSFLHGREIDQRLNPDEFESDAAYLAAGSKQFTDRLIRTVFRFAFVIPLFIVLRRFWSGVSFHWATTAIAGGEGLSLADILEAVLVVFVTMIVVTKIRGALSFVILPRTKLDRGLRYTVVMLTTYGMWTIGMVIALQILQVRGEHIAVFTGALAFGIGFGLQSMVKNFVSGLILLVERPVKVGDMVEVESRSGSVDKITLRATTVMTWDGIGVVIPNELMIGGSLINYSLGHPRLRSTLAVGVAYGSDIQKVRKILNEVVANHGLILKRPEPEAFFIGFGDSSLDFQILFWTNITTHRPRTLSDLRFALDAAFRRESIEIPFPQRDLHVRTVDGTVVGAFGGAKLPARGDGGPLDGGPAQAQGGSSEKSSS